ncbi:hypothetical protein TW95_gp1518 [Pandoravirus inopinatum]|uniref:Uncharacterized protein n=1 Tax=Pandoravirus inopinatum TaxID=1605721 RepID=A0A0B5JEP5_9VIRU|nr:hypothetical protein TW95_gp1518 [Pandoravirus inopinatum]AJF98252.1 hypothetical protein [Pandoravirus inopinatum]
MPPPPARTPLAREEAREADPRAHSLIAMHVAVAPRTPSTVVFFGVDASRASTCIALPVRTLPTVFFLSLFFSCFMVFQCMTWTRERARLLFDPEICLFRAPVGVVLFLSGFPSLGARFEPRGKTRGKKRQNAHTTNRRRSGSGPGGTLMAALSSTSTARSASRRCCRQPNRPSTETRSAPTSSSTMATPPTPNWPIRLLCSCSDDTASLCPSAPGFVCAKNNIRKTKSTGRVSTDALLCRTMYPQLWSDEKE